MHTLRNVLIATVVASSVATSAFAAKENFDRSKPHLIVKAYLERLDGIVSAGEEEIRETVGLLLPAVQKLRAEGRLRRAWLLTLQGVRRVRRRGHVTVLKISSTTHTTLVHLRRLDADPELVAQVEAARDAALARLRGTQQWAVDSFFDIWVEVSRE